MSEHHNNFGVNCPIKTPTFKHVYWQKCKQILTVVNANGSDKNGS